jgi:chromosome segregation ATPase
MFNPYQSGPLEQRASAMANDSLTSFLTGHNAIVQLKQIKDNEARKDEYIRATDSYVNTLEQFVDYMKGSLKKAEETLSQRENYIKQLKSDYDELKALYLEEKGERKKARYLSGRRGRELTDTVDKVLAYYEKHPDQFESPQQAYDEMLGQGLMGNDDSLVLAQEYADGMPSPGYTALSG